MVYVQKNYLHIKLKILHCLFPIGSWMTLPVWSLSLYHWMDPIPKIRANSMWIQNGQVCFTRSGCRPRMKHGSNTDSSKAWRGSRERDSRDWHDGNGFRRFVSLQPNEANHGFHGFHGLHGYDSGSRPPRSAERTERNTNRR
jgi:hypothetical protein